MTEHPHNHLGRDLHHPILLRWLAVVVVLIVVLLSTIQSLRTDNRVILLIMLALPVVFLLVNRQRAWLVLVLGLTHSWIYIPGFPVNFSLFSLAALTFLPVLLFGHMLRPAQFPEPRPLKFVAATYLLIALLVAAVRGMGLRVLGGADWGGAAYVNLSIAVLLYLLCDRIVLSPRQARLAAILYCSAVLLPAAAEMVFLLSRGSIAHQYAIIRPEGSAALSNLRALQQGQGVVRFQVSKQISLIFTLALALWPFRGRYAFRVLIAFLLAAGFVGISGHRSGVLYLIGLIPAAAFFVRRRVPVIMLISYFGILGIAVIVMHFAGTLLPLAVQRGLSWVPWANISHIARESAMSTTRWRFEVWKRVLDMLPDYWLLGRGFTFSSRDFLWLRFSVVGDPYIDWAIITHNYHSGPLSLLIDLGVPGFVTGSLLAVGGLVKQWRRLSMPWVTPPLARLHAVLLASYAVELVRFFIIGGDASHVIVIFLVSQMLMDVIYRANLSTLAPMTTPHIVAPPDESHTPRDTP